MGGGKRKEKPVLTLKQIKGKKVILIHRPILKVGVIIIILYMRKLKLQKIKLPKEMASK